jgi:hypothetical protein
VGGNTGKLARAFTPAALVDLPIGESNLIPPLSAAIESIHRRNVAIVQRDAVLQPLINQ